MSRFAKQFAVYLIEEPVFHNGADYYAIEKTTENVHVVKPYLNNDRSNIDARLKYITDTFIEEQQIENFIAWYYSPMYLEFTQHLNPLLIVYDCMDELSAFKFAPPQLKQAEKNLLHKADIVFTGGNSLYNAKKHLHHNIYAFPSSIDKEHFTQARNAVSEPEDQQTIPHPRLGFYGVLDERFDIDLIKQAADAKPEWHFVFIGPVVKIDENSLPKNSNIHYLGSRHYNELPAYLSGWDIALIPFAINESTKYISPTKTPEYLAAGKPVISTAIEDVVHPYGQQKLVHIIHSADEFIEAATHELNNSSKEKWLEKADAFLAGTSWDVTWQNMYHIIQTSLKTKQTTKHENIKAYV
jgi:UDP-galactopyranose mutase